MPEGDEGEIPQEHVGHQSGRCELGEATAGEFADELDYLQVEDGEVVYTDEVVVEMQALPFLVGEWAVILNASLRAHERKDVSK